MSRWPRGLEFAYRQFEAERRWARIETVMEQRRREYKRNRPLPTPIVDRDPGDEEQQP